MHSSPSISHAQLETTQSISPRQDDRPSNFAYDPCDGYKGLLLHYISPSLADRLYPTLTHPALPQAMGVIQLLAIGVSLPAMFVSRVPIATTHALFFLYIPTLHRILHLDFRIIWLQLKEFESQYLLVTWLLGLGSFLQAAGYPIVAINMYLSSFDSLFLDALRFPYKDLLLLVIQFMIMCWVMVITLSSRKVLYNDYEKYSSGLLRVSYISFTVARAATLGIFWTKYSVTALISPGAYAVLREPLASDYLTQPSITQAAPARQPILVLPRGAGRSASAQVAPLPPDTPESQRATTNQPQRSGHRSPSAKPSLLKKARTTVTSAVLGAMTTALPTALQEPFEGLLLHAISPRLANLVYPLLTSTACEYVMHVATCVGVALVLVSALAYHEHYSRLAFVFWPLLILEAAIQACMLDVRLMRQLLKDFETLFLLANLLGFLLCLLDHRVFKDWSHTAPHLALPALVTCSSIFVDASRLPPHRKAARVLCHGIGLTMLSMLPASGWSFVREAVNADVTMSVLTGVNTLSFGTGRLLTLGIFYSKSALLLWWWPNRFVVLHLPLERQDRRVYEITSLKDLGPVPIEVKPRTKAAKTVNDAPLREQGGDVC